MERLELRGATTMGEQSRFPPIALVEAYLARDIGGVLQFDGLPPTRVRIDPVHGLIVLQCQVICEAPDIGDFQNIAYRTFEEYEVRWSEAAFTVDDNVDEVYALLCAIADRVQIK